MENRILMMIIFFAAFTAALSISSFVIFGMINNVTKQIPLKALAKRTFIFNLIFVSVYFLTFMIQHDLSTNLHRIISYYFGFIGISLTIALVYWLIYFIMGFLGKNHFLFTSLFRNSILFLILAINTLSIYNFEKGVKVKNISLKSEKISKPYKIMMIGDVQYGSVSKKHMEDVFAQAVDQEPDLIALVGDLVDFDAYKSNDFDFLNDIKIPIYFINGNHEYYHGLNRITSYLKKINNLEILTNETVSYNDEIDIVGLDYTRSEELLSHHINNAEIDNGKFNMLLFHEPKGIEHGVKKGFDLMLYGHTHGGQFFPFTKLINMIYKYGNGFYQEENSVIYTTTGAGLWGPKMRLGTENEIVLFNLEPTKIGS
jgi:predicted MPP superfamily phosphohydrolase